MDGPRGSLVIGLLFLIAGQLAFIAEALTGNNGYALLGAVMVIGFAASVVRVIAELIRQGAAQRRPAARPPRAAASAAEPPKRRPPHA